MPTLNTNARLIISPNSFNKIRSPFPLVGSNLSVYVNEEKTRTFLGIY